MSYDFSENFKSCIEDLELIEEKIKSDAFDRYNGYLINFSIILASGAVEKEFKDIVYSALSIGTKRNTSNYLSNKIIDSSMNPSIKNICRLLNEIDNEINKEFKSSLEKDCKDKLDSLVELRNELSHGGKCSTNINEVITYFDSGKEVLGKLHAILVKSIDE